MSIYWPENLPLPIQYGASDEAGKGAKISTEMDYGNKRRRRRFTNVPDYQTITVAFNDNQLIQFRTFYDGVLQSGVLSFYANVIAGSVVEQRRCTIDDDSLKYTYDTYNRSTVTMVLEIYNILGLDEGAAWLIGTYGEDFVINGMADPLQYEVNVHYPIIMGSY